jgi:NADH-quinone oxidoreductase subunit H
MVARGGAVLGASPAWWITLLTFGSFVLKTAFFILIFMLVRWTVPRFRYDQVMDLGWKVMLPAALAAVVVTAATILALDSAGVQEGVVYGLVLTVVNVAMLLLILMVMDRGRILEGTGTLDEKRRAAIDKARRRRMEIQIAGD